jgi:hypothetical protein
MPRYIPAHVRYHGVDNAAPKDPTTEDEQRRERLSSSLDNSSATQDNPSSQFSGSQAKEKLVGNAGENRAKKAYSNLLRSVGQA